MLENRSKLRANNAIQGRAAFGEGIAEIACTVMNFSPAGACIVFPTGTVVPRSFALTIGAEPAGSLARTVWRRPDAVGVAFVVPRAAPEVVAG